MASWDGEQMANARTIVAVGLEMGMSSRDILIGLMTAMQESGLRNLTYGDRDSQGLFQQRPSQGWGTVAQVTNPLYSSRKFFSSLKKLNRTNMSLWQAAQAVQRSAFPRAYAKWENDARRMLNSLGLKGGLPFPLKTPLADLSDLADQHEAIKAPTAHMGGVRSVLGDQAAPAAPGAGEATGEIKAPEQPAPKMEIDENDPFFNLQTLAAGGARGAIVNAAMAVRGTPYSWGGGGSGGASRGIGRGAGTTGFDCSGLVQYAFSKAGIKMPRVTYDQVHMGRRAPISSLEPGDLVFTGSVGHVAIYIGGGQIVEAPYTGSHVRVSKVREGMFGVKMSLAGNAKVGTTGAAKAPDKSDPFGLATPTTPELVNVAGLEAASAAGIESGNEEEEGQLQRDQSRGNGGQLRLGSQLPQVGQGTVEAF